MRLGFIEQSTRSTLRILSCVVACGLILQALASCKERRDEGNPKLITEDLSLGNLDQGTLYPWKARLTNSSSESIRLISVTPPAAAPRCKQRTPSFRRKDQFGCLARFTPASSKLAVPDGRKYRMGSRQGTQRQERRSRFRNGTKACRPRSECNRSGRRQGRS